VCLLTSIGCGSDSAVQVETDQKVSIILDSTSVAAAVSKFAEDTLATLEIKLSQKNLEPPNKSVAEELIRQAKQYLLAKQLAKSERLLDVAAIWTNVDKPTRERADRYNLLGHIAKRRGLYELAITHYDSARSTYHRLDLPLGEAGILNNLGSLLVQMEQQDAAIERFSACLVQAQKINHEALVRSALYNLAVTYQDVGEYDKALIFAERTIEAYKKTPDPGDDAWGYISYANAAASLNNYDASFKSFQSVIDLKDQAYSTEMWLTLLIGITEGAWKTGRTEVAATYAASARAHIDTISPSEFVRDGYRLLSQYHADNDQPNLAFSFATKADRLTDSLSRQLRQQETSRLEVVYRTRERETELALLADREANTTARLTRTRRIGIALAAGILLLGTFAYLLFQKRKHLRRKKTQLTQALTHNQVLLSELHHRVKNNLQLISSLLSLELNELGLNNELSIYDRIATVGLLHDKLYSSQQHESVELKGYLRSVVELSLIHI